MCRRTTSLLNAPLNRLCPCYGAIEIVEVIIIIFFLNPRKKEGKKKIEIENAGMTTAPGGRPTQSRHVTKQN